MPKRRDDYHYWLYDYKYENIGSFFDYVAGLVKKNDLRMNVLVVSSQRNLKEEVQYWVPDKFTVEVKNSDPIFTITVTKQFNEDKTVTAKAVAVKYQDTLPVYLILSDSKSKDFKTVIAKLLNKHFPIVSRIFLTNGEMEMIFDKLEETTGLEMQVDSSVGKKRLARSRKKESQVTYTNMHYKDVFQR